MRVLGIIAITSLLAASAAQSEEVNGEELVEQFFADCDAVFDDPARILKMGDLTDDVPASATVDGNILSVTTPADRQHPSLSGVTDFYATILPGGMAANCSLSLFGSSISEQVGAQIVEAASARGQALVGKDAVKLGGLIGGPALFKAQAEGGSQIDTWATPDFPPTATVTVTASPRYSSVTISRYKAAP